jgi:hypothetical protein
MILHLQLLQGKLVRFGLQLNLLQKFSRVYISKILNFERIPNQAKERQVWLTCMLRLLLEFYVCKLCIIRVYIVE